MKKLAAYLAIAILNALSYMPLSWSQALGRVIGRRIYRQRTRLREVSRVNLQQAYPELTTDERERWLKNVMLHSGMTMAEGASFLGCTGKKLLPLVRHVHNIELLEQALAQDKGLLVCVPHQANWEILNAYLVSKDPIMCMYRPPKNPTLDRWLLKSRQETGATFVPTTRQGVEALFRQLNEKKMVGFLPDQEPKPERGVYAPFWHTQVLTPLLPHELLQKTGCQVLFACSQRLENNEGFDVHFFEPDASIYSEHPETYATALNEAIERCIATAPDQYCWTYKRMKRPQGGGQDVYTQAKVP